MPPIRNYRVHQTPSTNSTATAGDILTSLADLEENIADVEDSLCSKYQMRADLLGCNCSYNGSFTSVWS